MPAATPTFGDCEAQLRLLMERRLDDGLVLWRSTCGVDVGKTSMDTVERVFFLYFRAFLVEIVMKSLNIFCPWTPKP